MVKLEQEADQWTMAPELRQDIRPEPFESSHRFVRCEALRDVGFQQEHDFMGGQVMMGCHATALLHR
jgi:hypothetical protein